MKAVPLAPRRLPAGRARLYLPPASRARPSVHARGVGSKHGDDKEKPRPGEMPVVGSAGLRLGLLLNSGALCRTGLQF
jgi:hypothetical protein